MDRAVGADPSGPPDDVSRRSSSARPWEADMSDIGSNTSHVRFWPAAAVAALLFTVAAAEAAPRLPIVFEPNRGQADPEARFVARTADYTLLLTPAGAVVADRKTGDRVRIRLIGARPDVAIVGREPLPGRTHYLRGRDPSGWHTDVPHYARVVYRDPFPGIDTIYRIEAEGIAQDFVVQPGSDPAHIRLRFDGVTRIRVNADGELLLVTGGAPLRLSHPVAYQEGPGGRTEIPVAWNVRGESAGFDVGAWDRSRPLVIDPVIGWATRLGGGGDDAIFGIAVNAVGQVHTTGDTDSLDFPVTGGAALAGSSDAFAAKLDASGQVLLYAVFLGGGGDDGGRAIALDATNNAYIAGFTTSGDFPTTLGSAQRVFGGGMDAFVVKLGPTGTLIYATYLGGAEADTALGVAVDLAGRAHVAGGTRSADFPVVNAFLLQPLPGGGTCGSAPDTFPCRDAFVARLNTLGTNLDFSTFLGGGDDDAANAIALDPGGSAYVTGFTLSDDFPTTLGALQRDPPGGVDAFVARIDATAGLGWATYLGGAGADIGNGVAVDLAGRPHVVGSTTSADFPATGGGFSGMTGGFAVRLNTIGTALEWSRPLTQPEAVPTAVALDGDLLVVANDVVCTAFGPGVPPPCVELHLDVVVERLAADSGATVFVQTFGGTGNDAAGEDFGQAIAARDQQVWVAGYTAATDFPATGGSFQPRPQGGVDGFVVQIVDTTSVDDDDDDDGSSDCVIVTAAFGTPMAAEVHALRRFRDEVLLTNAPGRLLTRVYYRFGPALARQVAIHPRLAAAVRGIVRPLARATAFGLDRPVVATLAAAVLALGLALALRGQGRAPRAALAAGVMVMALAATYLALGPPEPRRPAADPAPAAIAADPASGPAVATAPPAARRLRDLSGVPGGASAPAASGQALTDRGGPPASSTSITLLDPLAPRADRRWRVTSDWIEGVLGPEGFRVTAPRAAAALGIAAGDVIVSVDGHPPRGVLAVFTSLQRDPDRATVTIEVDRSGTRLRQVYRVR
jgi:hypothetical protein